jgi:hypothetical protein
MSHVRSVLDRIPAGLGHVGFVLAAGLACAAGALFWAGTTAAIYVVLLAYAAVTGEGMGGPLGIVMWPLLALGLGAAVSVVVYTPLSLLLAWLARRRWYVLVLGLLFVILLTLAAGVLLALRFHGEDATEQTWSRITIAIVLPYFFAGGYALYWAVLFGLHRLAPWLVRKFEQL